LSGLQEVPLAAKMAKKGRQGHKESQILSFAAFFSRLRSLRIFFATFAIKSFLRPR
jgi:hypothetical protein